VAEHHHRACARAERRFLHGMKQLALLRRLLPRAVVTAEGPASTARPRLAANSATAPRSPVAAALASVAGDSGRAAP
jgi:hypothetical protein